jgi:hypothetical protein
MNKTGTSIKRRGTANDVFFTPLPVAKRMIEMCDITPDMTVLDPCYGGGVFYENLPECKKEFCEITMGKDFFDETRRFDLIIGNPPYSIWNEWIEHTTSLTDKFCFIFGYMNFSSHRFCSLLDKGYGITKMHLVTIDWWFSQSWIIVFEKNKPSIITVEPQRIYCDICNTRCKRGNKAFGPNICSKQKSSPIINA